MQNTKQLTVAVYLYKYTNILTFMSFQSIVHLRRRAEDRQDGCCVSEHSYRQSSQLQSQHDRGRCIGVVGDEHLESDGVENNVEIMVLSTLFDGVMRFCQEESRRFRADKISFT